MSRTATLLLAATMALATLEASGPLQENTKPRLLLFLTIDQARYDYLVRFRPVFEGGLKTLLEQGVIFTDAHHNHAGTATAPGHASLATGVHPSRSGIIANQWFDRRTGKRMYSVQDDGSPVLHPGSRPGDATGSSSSGRSPRNLLATTLADWMKKENPQSKVFTAGGKDRSSITVGGKTADAAFWYERETGFWVTSRYYLNDYPDWMRKFHARKLPDLRFGKAWEPIPVDPSLYRQLGIEKLDRGVYHWQMPHPLSGASLTPTSSFYTALFSSPFVDSYLVELAKTLVENESLGEDTNLDFLALCFSAVDAVGHSYGPNSPEVLDAFLKLDLALGELFAYLDQEIGMEHVAVALGADHGVMPLPEYLQQKGQEGKRFTTEDVLCYQGMEGKLDSKFGEEDWLLRNLYINYEAVGRRNLRREDVENEIARLLGQCSAVERAWTRTQLESPGKADSNPYFERFVNSFHADRSPDLLVQLKPFHIARLAQGATHGSPYTYDSHVPLILLFPGVAPTEVSERVATVDLAPTLAWLLGIPTPDDLDGVVRSSWLEATRSSESRN